MSRMQYGKAARIAQGIAPQRLKTPSLKVNRDLGGGFGYGRIATVFGTKSAGKTAFCVQTAGRAQAEEGKTVAFIDIEGTFESSWAQRLGLDVESTVWLPARTSEDITNKTVDVIEAGIDIVIVDSMSGMVPSAAFDDEQFQGFDKFNAMGLLARDTSKFMPIISAALAYNEAAVLLIAQVRSEKKGSLHWGLGATNGKALEFYSSQMIKLTSPPSSKVEEPRMRGGKLLTVPVGRTVDYSVEFNKLGSPWGTGSYKFYFDSETPGVDSYEEVVELAVENDIMRKGGAWYTYGEEKWQGISKVAEWLRENPDEYKVLREKIDGLL
jgi:recombination protein RecA